MNAIRFHLEVIALVAVYPMFLYGLCITVFRSTEKTPRTSAIPKWEAGCLSNQDKLESTGTTPTRPVSSRVNPTNTGERRTPLE